MVWGGEGGFGGRGAGGLQRYWILDSSCLLRQTELTLRIIHQCRCLPPTPLPPLHTQQCAYNCTIVHQGCVCCHATLSTIWTILSLTCSNILAYSTSCCVAEFDLTASQLAMNLSDTQTVSPASLNLKPCFPRTEWPGDSSVQLFVLNSSMDLSVCVCVWLAGKLALTPR